MTCPSQTREAKKKPPREENQSIRSLEPPQKINSRSDPDAKGKQDPPQRMGPRLEPNRTDLTEVSLTDAYLGTCLPNKLDRNYKIK